MILEITAAALLTCDPELTRLFTPLRPVEGRYEVCVTDEPIDAVKRADSDVRLEDAVDAFGTSGAYDRGLLMRLYSSRRPRVVRESHEEGGELMSVTLISPYPDRTLSRLVDGTMVIRYFTRISMLPLTTSIDITGSPDPSVVSPKCGPNLSFVASGMSEAIVPL